MNVARGCKQHLLLVELLGVFISWLLLAFIERRGTEKKGIKE
jgi:hypothetical protein